MTPVDTVQNAEALALVQARADCVVDIAQLALDHSQGDIERAVALVPLLSTSYLFQVVTIEETGRNGSTEGLVIVVWDTAHHRPRYVTAQLTTTALGHLIGASATSPGEWATHFKQFTEGQTGYERMLVRQLEEHLKLEAFPAGMVQHYIDQPKSAMGAVDLSQGVGELETALIAGMSDALQRKLSIPFKCRTCWYALDAQDYRHLALATGWALPMPQLESRESTPVKKLAQATMKSALVVRGTPIIDSNAGVVLDDIEPGDQVQVKITDQSPLAVRLGEHLGLREGGEWAAASWGRVQVVELTEADTIRLIVAISPRVRVEVKGLGTLRIRARLSEARVATSGTRPTFPVQLLGIGMAIVIGLVMLLVLGLD